MERRQVSVTVLHRTSLNCLNLTTKFTTAQSGQSIPYLPPAAPLDAPHPRLRIPDRHQHPPTASPRRPQWRKIRSRHAQLRDGQQSLAQFSTDDWRYPRSERYHQHSFIPGVTVRQSGFLRRRLLLRQGCVASLAPARV